MYGIACDKCGQETTSEDDHLVTGDGDYIHIRCADKMIVGDRRQGANIVSKD